MKLSNNLKGEKGTGYCTEKSKQICENFLCLLNAFLVCF